MKRKNRSLVTILVAAAVVVTVALPAQALITNSDIASNAGISYSKLKLSGKIDSDDIKNSSIKGKDIKNGTIEDDDIATGAVGAAEIADDVVDGADLADTITLDAALAINGANVSIGSDLTVAGGELYVTGVASSASTTEGTIYYDTDDDNLYVYANGAFVDLTAGAAGAASLDDGYNASAGASTVLVDAGDLTLRSNAGATGDIIVDLNSTGDFLIQDAGVTFMTFSDTGGVTMASGTLALNGDAVTADGDLAITGATGFNATATTGDLDVTSSAGSIILTAAEAVADAIVLNASTALGGIDITSNNDIDITTTGAAGEDITLTNTGGSINLTATEAATDAIVISASTALGGIDITSNEDIDITTTGADGEDISLTNTGGSVVITATEAAADAIVLNASTALGGIDITSNADVDITTTGAAGEDISLVNTGGSVILTGSEDATDAIDINATAGGIDIDATGEAGQDIAVTNTGGSVTIEATEAAADAIVLNASTAAGGIDITSNADVDITTTGEAGEDISLTNTGGSINLTATEAATDAIVISASTALGGIDITSNEDLDITTTGAAGEDITLTNTGGSVNVTATEAAADAIVLNASGGGMDISAVDDMDITLTAGAAAEDLTIAVAGAVDASLILQSAGTGTDAIKVNATAGGLDIDSALAVDFDTAAGNIVLDSVDGGEGGVVPEDDGEDNLGAAATRWASVFANTLNFENTLTDSASAGGDAANVTVTLGNSSANDTVGITANTTITDAQWSVTAAGVATFASVDGPLGSVTPAAVDATTIQLDDTLTFDTNNDSINNAADDTFDFTREDAGTVTITASDDDATAALTVTPGGAAAMTLGTNASTTAITLATDGTGTAEVVLPTGAIGAAEIDDDVVDGADMADTITLDAAFAMNGQNMTFGDGTGETVEINSTSWDVSTAGVGSGFTGFTSTGAVDFSGATLEVPNGTDLPATCAIGTVYHDTNDDACADADAGDGALCICKALNTWAAVANF